MLLKINLHLHASLTFKKKKNKKKNNKKNNLPKPNVPPPIPSSDENSMPAAILSCDQHLQRKSVIRDHIK